MTKTRKQNREQSPKISDETKKLTIAQKLQSMSKINLENHLQRWQALLSPNENELSLQESIDIASKKFDERNEMVLAQISDVQAEEFINESSDLMSKATWAMYEIKTQLTALTAVSTAAPDTTIKNTSQSKLPPIPLPHFNGNYDGWASFKDQFETAVHSRKLSNVEKLVYLKQCVHGPADSLIKNLATTGENYQVARKMLEDEFKNERLHLKTLLTRVVDCKSVNEENLAHLRALYSTFNETSQINDSTGMGSGEWHVAPLAFHKNGQRDSKRLGTRNPGSDCLKFEDLLKFLGNKIRSEASLSCCMKVQKEKPILIENKKPKAFKCFFASCNERHSLMQCEKIKTASMKDRKDFVKKSSLCLNCLRKGHVINYCSSESRCKQCDGKYHTLPHETVKTQQVLKCDREANSCDLITALPTAEVTVLASNGQRVKLRALIDTRARMNVITANAQQKLGLKITASSERRIIGVNQRSSMPVNGKIETTMYPKKGQPLIKLCRFGHYHYMFESRGNFATEHTCTTI